MQFIAKTFSGLEELLAEEIKALGGKNIQLLTRGVQFEGNKKLLYRANYELRTALRILVPVASFQVSSDNVLYEKVRDINWNQWMSVENTLAVDAVTFSENLNHSHFIALRTKDAIVDQFRGRTGKRPSINTEKPDLAIQVHIGREDLCTVSLDSSGVSLHQRGTKLLSTAAPVNEVLAAGMILLSGWDKKTPLMDFMCGSGTILMEAAMILRNIPPQFKREYFSFHHWKDFDPALWSEVVKEAQERIVTAPRLIYGIDINKNAVNKAVANIQGAGLEDVIQVESRSFQLSPPPAENGVIITNPPYGERLNDEQEVLNELYRAIGDKLKQDYKGWWAWLISSNTQALKHIGLHPTKKRTLFNGPLECKFLGYELFQGKRKEHLTQTRS
jgi:putative N6-adenine-specific DNA methylase